MSTSLKHPPHAPQWLTKPLSELSPEQWESLCDGCGRCCLVKLEDTETAQVHYTDVACQALDLDTCRCTIYPQRTTLMPDCLTVTHNNPAVLKILPHTCAYRCLDEGRPLPSWHPLLSGTADSVIEAQISIRGKCITEEGVHPDEFELHIIELDD